VNNFISIILNTEQQEITKLAVLNFGFIWSQTQFYLQKNSLVLNYATFYCHAGYLQADCPCNECHYVGIVILKYHYSEHCVDCCLSKDCYAESCYIKFHYAEVCYI